MYSSLYEAWLKEKTNAEMQELPSDFYERLADYIARIRRESRMLDSTSVKSKLISRELKNVRKLTEELLQTRLQKAIDTRPHDLHMGEGLVSGEREIFLRMKDSFNDSQTLLKHVLHGTNKKRKEKTRERKESSSRSMVRFTKGIPEFVGVDLKSYGPFEAEDVATLPKESAKVLMQQRIVEEVETS